jgi:hypothetical protein
VTWQEISRIRSTAINKKATYVLEYDGTAEAIKAFRMFAALSRSSRSVEVRCEEFFGSGTSAEGVEVI